MVLIARIVFYLAVMFFIELFRSLIEKSMRENHVRIYLLNKYPKEYNKYVNSKTR